MWVATKECYEKVDVLEEPLICESALQSIKELHDNGFSHGDVDLRNLRVQRTESSSVSQWKCWWIDPGLSTDVYAPGMSRRERIRFDLDCKECLYLFQIP